MASVNFDRGVSLNLTSVQEHDSLLKTWEACMIGEIYYSEDTDTLYIVTEILLDRYVMLQFDSNYYRPISNAGLKSLIKIGTV